MVNKKFILNADDFGLSKFHNQAALEGYNNGFLTSASLCANGEAFDSAVHDIIPDCPNLGVGVHLNIIEGKALTSCPLLTNKKSEFDIGYLYLLLNSRNQNLLDQIENEFRAQIEKIAKVTKVDHLDSHVHTHSIPAIFDITCKLAKEFGIPYVRTQFEEFYLIPKFTKHLSFKYPINIIKVGLLQFFTELNRVTLDKYNLNTNDSIIGVGYTGMMDADAIEYGLKAIEDGFVVEALIHPCKYDKLTKNSHAKEFLITQDKTLQDTISRLGFEITNYKNLDV
ncbi:MAG: ChbG/HpnK family deacetylase [Muribaculaceae bacterium]|nr:ChbG/HpnK family deacetylase [Muribaculaceae bacterium]